MGAAATMTNKNCQSRVTRAMVVVMIAKPEFAKIGTVSVTAADSSATSSVDRDTKSPVPASSTRWTGSPRAVPTMSSRKLAITRSVNRERTKKPQAEKATAANAQQTSYTAHLQHRKHKKAPSRKGSGSKCCEN